MNLTENQKKWGAWAVMLVAVLVAGALGIQYPLPEPPSEAPPDVVALGTTNLDTLELSGSLTAAGAVDVGTTLNFGTGDLYPLAYATTGYEIVCGTSGTFTETTTVSVSGITAISYAVVTQITDPASTGAIISVDAPTTSTLTINSWETDATEGTTGVNVYYCAVGTE